MPKFEREVEIDAPVEKVWEVLTDPKHWHQWFPGVDSAVKAPALREGGSFEWTSEGRTGRGAIVKMEPLKQGRSCFQAATERRVPRDER
jgi:uncharacterized protein YndB with AHSA1/START domain